MESNFRSEIIQFLKSECELHKKKTEIKDYQTQRRGVYLPQINCLILFHQLTHEYLESPDIKSVHIGQFPNKIIHVWEDQWIYQGKKLESKLKSLLGTTERIHGRTTSITRLNNQNLINFLEDNHLNVAIKAKYKFGIIKEDELLAAMSFSSGREIERNGKIYNSYELLRFCNRLNITVVGGFSKLLNHFINMYQPDDIMTYVDADWSDGELYTKLGFEYADKVPPMEFWLNQLTGLREYPRFVLKMKNLPMTILESAKDKSRFLRENGYLQVFNSGSYKFILKLK